MLGHAETVLVIRMLADCLRNQGEFERGMQLMAHRAQLAGLARVFNSALAQQTRSEQVAFERTTRVG